MYPILEIKSGREKSLLNKHPWIFSGAVQKLPKAENGDIIEIRDKKQSLYGYGFYSPQSQIICRIFTFTQEGQVIDQKYWLSKIENAYQLRKTHVINPQTNAFRLIHAEGDFLPGVIADVYGKVVVLQLLIKGAEKIYQDLVAGFKALGFEHIYLKTKDNSHFLEDLKLDKAWLTEEFEENIIISENSLRFPIDVVKGQKTGFFIDQRDNRLLLKGYAKGKSVLNTFSYTGGFSVYALAGGATEVHSVDISKDAILICDETIELNFPNEQRHQSFAEDCFDFLKKRENQYDIVILDPPAFAKNKKSVPNASRGYISLNELGLKRVKPGGLLFTFSCSGNIDRDLFRKIIFTAAAQTGRNIRIIHQLSQPIDHPVNIYHPEGEYLKGLVLYVE